MIDEPAVGAASELNGGNELNGEVLLEAEGLARYYTSRGPWGAERKAAAVEDVSLRILRGETLALVGESGCGKSTTARLLLGLEPPTSGTVRYRGRDLGSMSRTELLGFRRRVQLVFQDPFGSLNPRMTIGGMLGEVLSVHALAAGAERGRRITELLDLVGLGPEAVERYPHEFSGGQRQRIGIARALAVEPDIIVADEPVSALDVSIQAQVLNLLADLQERLDLSYLFIAHDLAVVRQVADRVAVMYAGRIVEASDAAALYHEPLHPYTRSLLAAVPRPRPPTEKRKVPDLREGADPPGRPTGCPYLGRCRHPARDEECSLALPLLEERSPGRWVRCIKT